VAKNTKYSELPEQFFERQDTLPDIEFYRAPRFVAHIDDVTIDTLTDYYREFLYQGADVLDLMSSWISHFPLSLPLGRVAGLGMNAAEMDANPVLNEYCVHDLNADMTLPYTRASFDRVTIAVSVQYLIRPIEVMSSITTVLRPGGRLCVAMSHRMFPTKAIRAFHQLSPSETLRLVMTYLERGGFVEVECIDRSPSLGDPLWLVVGNSPGV
jgi:SAM-dependent methyltransferase